MRHFVLLAVLLLAPLAVGDSIDFQGAGTLSNHTAFTIGRIAAGRTWAVGTQLIQIDNITTGHNQTGDLGVIDITTGTLSHCSSGFCFTGGTLDIDNLSNKDLFFGALKSGTITMNGATTILSAVLSNGATSVIRENNNTFSSQALVRTSAAVIPEPASMTLMGTGLLSFAFAVFRNRRKEA